MFENQDPETAFVHDAELGQNKATFRRYFLEVDVPAWDSQEALPGKELSIKQL